MRRGMNYDKNASRRLRIRHATPDVVGDGYSPPKPEPTNILLRPLKLSPMRRIQGSEEATDGD